ncbi:hypothetical protein BXY85_3740 [Roseivirga pacifica]|uniref:Uncharacterized protein n=1 Tax=Roseivirga pacifica TaxID=1267423 RepID=A0A1I0Q9E3_9BACT|nr:hypothetical protein [Roseivirga pacifica]RKQ43121.1 hypothetical protein BXY85_3740 [Roseivirga pacifica]SEW23637.1 hypothetical protein SAMN05216290_2135 [Roseivirga pacifica]
MNKPYIIRRLALVAKSNNLSFYYIGNNQIVIDHQPKGMVVIINQESEPNYLRAKIRVGRATFLDVWIYGETELEWQRSLAKKRILNPKYFS